MDADKVVVVNKPLLLRSCSDPLIPILTCPVSPQLTTERDGVILGSLVNPNGSAVLPLFTQKRFLTVNT